MHVLLHARRVLSFHLFHLGLLFRRQHLEHLVVNAGLRDRELDVNLGLLRGQGPDFGFVERAFLILVKLPGRSAASAASAA